MQWLIDIIKEWLQVYLQGMIVLWSGSEFAVPDGWHLCDGTEGTPDLRLKFVMGAGIGFGVGSTGGETEHWHTGGSHRHTRARSQNAGSGTTKYSVSTAWTGYTDANTGTRLTLPPYYVLAYIMKL